MAFQLNTTVMETAEAFAQKKHGQVPDRNLLRATIEKIATLKEKMKFEEAMRFTLNELHLRDEARILYRCAAGKYFSTISGLVRHLRAEAGKPPKRARLKPSITGTAVLEGNQWAFKM